MASRFMEPRRGRSNRLVTSPGRAQKRCRDRNHFPAYVLNWGRRVERISASRRSDRRMSPWIDEHLSRTRCFQLDFSPPRRVRRARCRVFLPTTVSRRRAMSKTPGGTIAGTGIATTGGAATGPAGVAVAGDAPAWSLTYPSQLRRPPAHFAGGKGCVIRYYELN